MTTFVSFPQKWHDYDVSLFHGRKVRVRARGFYEAKALAHLANPGFERSMTAVQRLPFLKTLTKTTST